MGYCFFREEKLKSTRELTKSYRHNYRLQPVPNADILAATNNKELVSLNGKTYQEAFEEKIKRSDYYYEGEIKKRKYRKDAVRAIEVVTTFSREEKDNVDIEKWQKDNVEWLQKTFNRRPDKYGDNVVSVVFHGDEVGNVHCHAIIIPIDEKGALNAKGYINGPSELRRLQTDYAKAMEPHGLERGLEKSTAKHTDIKKFYTSLNHELSIEAPELKKGEKSDAYRERVTEIMRMQNAKHYNQRLQMERKIDEIKTKNRQILTETRKEMHEIERERDWLHKEKEKLVEEHGSMEMIRGKLKTVDLLNDAIEEYPDREYARKVRQGMQVLMDYKKKKENEKKKQAALEEKQKSDRKDRERKAD